MATISTSGISAGQIIRSEHLLRVINALNGVTPIDIIITGSLSVSGSTSFTGSTYLKGLPNASRANVITYDPTTGQLSYLDSASLGVTMSVSQPGGSNTQIQYNSGSVLAANSSFTFNYLSSSLQQGNNVIANGTFAHSQGNQTTASGQYSHAEGATTQAKGLGSHAEGVSTIASGSYSHAEGSGNIAQGIAAHAEGENTQAIGNYSHTEGQRTVSLGDYQHVQGQFNISSSAQSAFIIGNGTSNSNRSNLVFASGSTFQVTGSLNVSGSITGSLFGTASWAANELVTSSYIDSYIGSRIVPSSAASNGFVIEKSVNGNIGFIAKNNDTSGNGAISSFGVGPSGSWYSNGASFMYFNNGYYITSLRNTAGIYSSANFNMLLINSKDFSVQTGNDITTFTTKFKVSGSGNVYIPSGNLEITGSLIITGSQVTNGYSNVGTSMVIGSTTQGQILGNSALLLYRGQSNTAFTLGNPGIGQTNDIIIDNTLGSYISSSGFLSLNTPTGSLTLNGSGSVIINDILALTPRSTTPNIPANGMVIVSGSGVDQHIYCYLNSTWKQLD